MFPLPQATAGGRLDYPGERLDREIAGGSRDERLGAPRLSRGGSPMTNLTPVFLPPALPLISRLRDADSETEGQTDGE